MNGVVLLIIIILVGLTIYFVKPKLFFIYWLSIQPVFIPFFYILFKSSFTPFQDKLYPVYTGFAELFSYLILILSFFSILKTKRVIRKVGVIIIPVVLLLLFLIIQNITVGFHINALSLNVRKVLWSVAPFLLLISNEKVRPKRATFVNYIYFFVSLQLFFCCLNLFGFRIYDILIESYAASLVCGTFAGFNVMANHLAIFFFILTYEYLECKGIKRRQYYLMAYLIGLMIAMSGSRMCLLLFTFTIFYFIFNYKSKKYFLAVLFISACFIGVYIIGNKSYIGERADDGTGFERNLIGIIDLANSDDLSEGSTLSMSAYLLLFEFNSPLFGNGEAFRSSYFYGDPDITEYKNENVYQVDARLAFMLVEYGILGLSLFFYLYGSIFKGCHLYSEEHRKSLYWGAGLYFLFFSFTDPGFWDLLMFSVLPIYVFSIKKKNKSVGIMKSFY